MEKHEWPAEFFGGPEDFYGTTYNAMGTFDKAKTEKEVDGVLTLLEAEPGSHILDWCGGWGRHAIPLAKRGFYIDLLDFAYIDEAMEYAKQEGVIERIAFSGNDFRETPNSIKADYAINLFTAGLGYLGEEQDLIALRSLHAALKPGAKVLIDTINLFWIAQNFRARTWEEGSGGKDQLKRLFRSRQFDYLTNTMHEQVLFQEWFAVAKEGYGHVKHLLDERERQIHLRMYSPAELARVLRLAGFEPEKLCGDFDGLPFTFDSKRLIMVARKA